MNQKIFLINSTPNNVYIHNFYTILHRLPVGGLVRSFQTTNEYISHTADG